MDEDEVDKLSTCGALMAKHELALVYLGNLQPLANLPP